MLHSIYFSPSGTTAKIAGLIGARLCDNCASHDITVKPLPELVIEDADDIVLLAVPVYAGRVPRLASERLSAVRGRGQKAIAVAVYGNRDYEDALAELCDIAVACGFEVVGAGAFIAEHCIFPKVAAGRPDSGDEQKIAAFVSAVGKNISEGRRLHPGLVKGNRPYRKPGPVPLHPDVDSRLCDTCGACARQCPTGAIDASDLRRTDSSKCISCCRCIHICPRGARRFGGMLYKAAGWKFTRDNSRRLEPEWFV